MSLLSKIKNPDDLLANFTSLEEKNLFLIQTTQEAEQAYEEKKQEFNAKRKRFEKQEIKGLTKGLSEVKERIHAINDEMTKAHNLVTEGRAMPPDTEKRLKHKVIDTFKHGTEHGL